MRWIGGGSGAGKSTVAARLGERFGVPVVHTDLSLRRHAGASAGVPRVAVFVVMAHAGRGGAARPSVPRWSRRALCARLETTPLVRARVVACFEFADQEIWQRRLERRRCQIP